MFELFYRYLYFELLHRRVPKDKKEEAHQNWVGKIVLKFNLTASDFDLNAPRMNSSACKMAEILSKKF